MITVEYHPEKNILHVIYSGETTAAQMEALYQKVKALGPAFKPGLRLLSDLSRTASPSLELREGVAKFMELMNFLGVREIIRVIPDPAQDIGLNIMSLFHYDPEVRFKTVESCDQVKS